MTSVTVHPAQAAALVELLAQPGAVALDIAPDEHWSLRVAVYYARADREDAEAPAEARWFSVSVAGSVREIAPTPEQVAA